MIVNQLPRRGPEMSTFAYLLAVLMVTATAGCGLTDASASRVGAL